MNDRVYISVPFHEKDTAKGLGAKWDPVIKSWYVPSELSIEAFMQWDISFSESEGHCDQSILVIPPLFIIEGKNEKLERVFAIGASGVIHDLFDHDGHAHRLVDGFTIFSNVNSLPQDISLQITKHFPTFYPDFSQTM